MDGRKFFVIWDLLGSMEETIGLEKKDGERLLKACGFLFGTQETKIDL